MRKSNLNVLIAAIAALLLVSACSEDKSDVVEKNAAEPDKTTKHVVKKPNVEHEKGKVSKPVQLSVMDEPVNFSSPYEKNATVEKIRKYEGAIAIDQLNNAIKYLLASSPEFKNNMPKMLESLNGKTPNEILKMASH